MIRITKIKHSEGTMQSSYKILIITLIGAIAPVFSMEKEKPEVVSISSRLGTMPARGMSTARRHMPAASSSRFARSGTTDRDFRSRSMHGHGSWQHRPMMGSWWQSSGMEQESPSWASWTPPIAYQNQLNSVEFTDGEIALMSPVSQLVYYAGKNNIGKVRELIEEQKVPSNGLSEVTGFSALSMAARWAKFDVMRYLLEKDAQIQGKFGTNQETILMAAVRSGHLDAVKLIIEYLKKSLEQRYSQLLAMKGQPESRLRALPADVITMIGRYDLESQFKDICDYLQAKNLSKETALDIALENSPEQDLYGTQSTPSQIVALLLDEIEKYCIQ